MVRFCKRCETEKSESLFPFDKRIQKHYGKLCQACYYGLQAERRRCEKVRQRSNLLRAERSKRDVEYRKNNTRRVREYTKKNPEKVRKARKEHYEANKELYRERGRQYRKKNPATVDLASRKRRSAMDGSAAIDKRPRTINKMNAIYKKASELREHGFYVEVDHIIPLQHELVCGLHVPANLQILTRPENRRKSNKFDGTHDNTSWRKR